MNLKSAAKINISSHRKHNTLLHFLEANEKTAPLFDLQNSDNLAEIKKVSKCQSRNRLYTWKP